jgi:hypothetical protein
MPTIWKNGRKELSNLRPVVQVGSVVFAKKVDDNGSVVYIGEAEVGADPSSAVWRIQRITLTGDDIEIQWANDADFVSVWNNRASLTYV